VKPITPEHREMLLGSGQELQNKVSQGLVGEVIAVLPFRSNFNELAKQSFAAHFPELMAELDTWNAAVENGVTTEAHRPRIFGYLMRIWVAEISWVETCPACRPI
jgi:hypothetical protein